MKVFVVFSAVLAIAFAGPSGSLLTIPLTRTGFAIPTALQTQFHAQDALGQYSYGYADGLSAKQEVRAFDGSTAGSYSYVDAEGKLQSVDYTADDVNGFRVAATNLPKAPKNEPLIAPLPVSDTPEVLLARQAHLAALNEAQTRVAAPAPAPVPVAAPVPEQELKPVIVKAAEPLPLKPVEDTPEVAQAKAEHLAAKKEAELRNAAVFPTTIIGNAAYLPAIRALPLPLASAAVRTLPLAPAAPLLSVVKTAEAPRGFAYTVHGPSSIISNTRFLSGPIVF